MNPSDAVVQLLTEIRDTQREHLAEYRRVAQIFIEYHRDAAEVARQQHEFHVRAAEIANQRQAKAIASSRAFTWALYLFIGLSLGANLYLIVQISGSR